ncbi:hypothetical protein DBR40_24685 [Pedobacter sp. KBW01]|uniref:hypothetical protein n=1 Tax=Pedobacter sp. KBW01 TaxID=2153364 RepID=UPI000F5A99F1|nr:hypothetical protein [Pedobacter sp. KBW01]RQO65073.1 hypothetical protein DBR40_24685 [Pedobacter sp. KBW01]
MSVVLTTPPPVLALSADKITAKFTCTGIYDQVGVKAINSVAVPDVAPGVQIVLQYGSQTVTMTAAITPDDSGYQFHGSTGGLIIPIWAQIECFKANYILSRDFDISLSPGGLSPILLTAKKTGLGFNITGYNTTPGVTEIIKSNYGILFNLYLENADNTGFDLVYEATLTAVIGTSIIAEAIIDDKLHDNITAEIFNNLPDVPEDSPLLCKKSCRRYYFEYAECYGEPLQIRKRNTSGIFTVIHGGMSYIGQGTKTISNVLFPPSARHRFIKQGENISFTRSNQPQYLYYYNPGITFAAKLKCRLRFTDGSKAQVDLHSFSLLEKRKYAFNVTYAEVYTPLDHGNKILLGYEIWLSTDQGERITETQTYLMDYRPLQYIRYFLNWSSWGSFDSRMFYGKGSTEFDVVQSEATKPETAPSDLRKGTSLVFDVKISSKLSVTTGFIKNRSILIFMRDFFLSPLKYRIAGNQLLPLKVTTKTITEIEDGNNLLAQKFEYQYLYDDHAFTEGDVQEPGIIYIDENTGFANIYLTDKEYKFLATSINHDLITI